MAIVPRSNQEMLDFFANHVAPWTTNSAAIGVSPDQLLELTNRLADAQNAFTNRQVLAQQAKSATETQNLKLNALRTFGGDLVKTISVHAETTGDDDVYGLAQIPAPKTPEDAPAPTTPANITATLNAGGSIQLNWTATNAAPHAGNFFIILRKITEIGETAFTIIGSTGEKTFEDDTVPANVNNVQYMMRAERGKLKSKLSLPIAVQFGSGSITSQSTLSEPGTIADAA